MNQTKTEPLSPAPNARATKAKLLVGFSTYSLVTQRAGHGSPKKGSALLVQMFIVSAVDTQLLGGSPVGPKQESSGPTGYRNPFRRQRPIAGHYQPLVSSEKLEHSRNHWAHEGYHSQGLPFSAEYALIKPPFQRDLPFKRRPTAPLQDSNVTSEEGLY